MRRERHGIRIRVLWGLGAVALLGAGTAAQVLGAGPDNNRATAVDGTLATLRSTLSGISDPDERRTIGQKIGNLEIDRQTELDGRAAASQPGFAAAAASKRDRILAEGAAIDAQPPVHTQWTRAGAGYLVDDADPFESSEVFVRDTTGSSSSAHAMFL